MNIPFPGMDPYLEPPALWPGFHARMIVTLADQLAPLVKPRYVVSVEDRVYMETTPQQRIPDIWVQKGRANDTSPALPETQAAAPVVIEVEELEIREHYLEVLDRYRDMKVVAVIEMISPSNKARGPGRRAYRAKQRETLARDCHLVEIDLLRTGRPVLRVPQTHLQTVRPCDYLICVNRWPRRKRFELYPFHLRDHIPSIRIPLTDPDPDQTLNIQNAFEKVYENGSYLVRVRYEEPCVPPLEPADQQWANECWAAYRAARPDLFPRAQP